MVVSLALAPQGVAQATFRCVGIGHAGEQGADGVADVVVAPRRDLGQVPVKLPLEPLGTGAPSSGLGHG